MQFIPFPAHYQSDFDISSFSLISCSASSIKYIVGIMGLALFYIFMLTIIIIHSGNIFLLKWQFLLVYHEYQHVKCDRGYHVVALKCRLS